MKVYGYSVSIIVAIYVMLKLGKIEKEKSNKIFLVISGSILIILYGLRKYTVGVDTHTYIEMFKGIEFLEISDLSGYWTEYGYTLLNKLIHIIGGNEQILLIICGVVIIGGMFKYIYKNSVNVIFSVYLYLVFMYYFSSMNAMRQFIAIGIVYFSLEYLFEKKNKKFLIGVFIASLFHKSALICVLLYLIRNRRLTIEKIISIIILVFLGIKSGVIDILIAKTSFNNYMESSWYEAGNWSNFIVYGSILIFVLFISKVSDRKSINKNLNKNNRIYSRENIIYWGIYFSMLFQLCATQIHIFVRIANYFMMFSLVIIPNSIYKINDKKIRSLAYIGVVVATLMYAYIYIQKGAQGTIPYEFCWGL